jgi:Tfp pilus assembly protein PilO
MNDLILDLNDKLQEVPKPAKIVVAILLICGSGYYSWDKRIPPARKRLESAQRESASLDNEIAQLRQQLQSLEALQEQLQIAENSLRGLLQFLPTDMEIAKLLANFSERARMTAVEIKQFLPGTPNVIIQRSSPPPSGNTGGGGAGNPNSGGGGNTSNQSSQSNSGLASSPMSQVPVKVSAVGTYHEIVQFLDKMMELPRIIKIENFVLQTFSSSALDGVNTNTDRTSPKLLVDVDFMTFFQGASDLAMTAQKRDVPLPPNATGPNPQQQPVVQGPPQTRPVPQNPQPTQPQQMNPNVAPAANPNASSSLEWEEELIDSSEGLSLEQIQALREIGE